MKATSYAARIKDSLKCQVNLEPNHRRGHFDIQVDGRTVVSRKGGLLAKLFRKPWPNPEDVVAAVREAIQQADG